MNSEKGNKLFDPKPSDVKGSAVASSDLTEAEKVKIQMDRLDTITRKQNRLIFVRLVIVAVVIAAVGASQYAVMIYSRWVAMAYTAAGFVVFTGAGVILVVAAIQYAITKWR